MTAATRSRESNPSSTSGLIPPKEKTVDKLQMMMVMMAVSDPEWRSNRPDKRRELSAEQLDALADFGWHFPALKRFLVGWSNAVQERWRASARAQSASAALAPMDAK
jgi:hypothetical protein